MKNILHLTEDYFYLMEHLLLSFIDFQRIKVKEEKKVFFIGFNKTGTGFYNTLFKSHNYKTLHYSYWRTGNPRVLRKYDVFSDGCLHNFKKIYRLYPNAHYILNTRPLRAWLISKANHVEHNILPDIPGLKHIINYFHRKIWGTDAYYDKKTLIKWINERENYHNEVKNFFQNKKLLILNIEDEEKLQKLEQFMRINIKFSDKKLNYFKKTLSLRKIALIDDIMKENNLDPNSI